MAYLDTQESIRFARRVRPVRPGVQDTGDTFADFGAKTSAYSAHNVIYYEGDAAQRLFEVASGTVMLFKLLPDGRRQVVEVLRPGEIFGLAGSNEYECTAETLTDASIHELDLRLVDSNLDVQRKLAKCLANQMRILHEHAVLLGRKSAVERVASFLMYLIPNRGGVGCLGPENEDDDGYDLKLHMTRQEIADYLGLTIETVSRVVSDLKRRGVIRVDRSDQIHLRKVCSLCQMTGMH
ncbi:Crp/Fnr family transcriptional regulator [Roseibium sediminis]|uniref:Crp/Fnr family transcriptional regulator n=1 Tax=Roseibium sediminis TaxID=1775174 RepID=UPI00123D525A|nr:helix-turn-helix domain-containing protein [Roseibium sediminis]